MNVSPAFRFQSVRITILTFLKLTEKTGSRFLLSAPACRSGLRRLERLYIFQSPATPEGVRAAGRLPAGRRPGFRMERGRTAQGAGSLAAPAGGVILDNLSALY
jgi:hypothetical protein